MAKYSKFNIVYILQKWMDSVAGQTFMNYAYSWGASIVILGTLFKLTHLPGANLMLFIGMGTEVFVFFIAAFDRPFDKTADGRNLASDAELAAQLAGEELPSDIEKAAAALQPAAVGAQQAAVQGGQTIIIGQPSAAAPQSALEPSQLSDNGQSTVAATAMQPSDLSQATPAATAVIAPTPAPAVSPETAEQMEDVTKTYIERLEQLNETLLKVAALSEKLSIDSEEMENLNRTLTGIARVYEMQLKSASQQITTQDDINSQTRKMAESIAELNSCYARMIEAMTVNVPGAAPKQ